jgi:hypothetical protein
MMLMLRMIGVNDYNVFEDGQRSDLVGSTALSARMDPEDLREVISAYQNALPRQCAGAVGS